MEITKHFFDLLKAGKKNRAVKLFLRNYEDITKNARDYLDSLDVKKKTYFYLVTFTMKPECVAQADQIEAYIKKQFTSRPSLQIVTAHIARELTKAGIPHWHVQVESSTPLSKDRFDYYRKIYGHVDVSKTRSQNPQKTLEYISKETHVEHLSQEGDSKDLTQESPQKPQKWDRTMFLDFD